MNKKTAIGIDLGGTRIKGVLITDSGEILFEKERFTNDPLTSENSLGITPWQEGIRVVVEELKQTLNRPVDAIGLAAPGLPDAAHRCIAYMPGRLQGLEGLIWADFLGEKKLPVINDAQAALWAETRLGAGKGFQNVVLLTLGTGVGGGILINGSYCEGFLQRAGHLGHFSLDAESEIQGISNMPGSLEDAIGESTVKRRTFGRYDTTVALVKAYESGDPAAAYFWLNSVRKLAIGIAGIVNMISPERVILGGGITRAGNALFEPLSAFMDIFEWRPNQQSVTIVPAAFSDRAGATGAALYALSNL
ncbi:MAG: ROK family protein [Bacteroidia bacterium]|nr:ROK family protein [Bacteroidia bacterium]